VPSLNYDFWYQPRRDVLISSEFGEPNAYEEGFDIADVSAGRYGQRLHFWSLSKRELARTVDLGEAGLIPLEVRWLHNPEADGGFVGDPIFSEATSRSDIDASLYRASRSRRNGGGQRG
jgi:selenium-binding protein 1